MKDECDRLISTVDEVLLCKSLTKIFSLRLGCCSKLVWPYVCMSVKFRQIQALNMFYLNSLHLR